MHSKKILSVLTVANLCCAYASSSITPLSVAQEFRLFQDKYHIVYTSPEITEYRKQIFAENLAKINKINAENHTWKLGINQYADQTWEEFSQKRLLNTGWQSQLSTHFKGEEIPLSKGFSLPDSVNWRTAGAVTPVKNQGQCGSSWTFATTGLMEGAGFIQVGTLYSLSEQEFLDCDTADSACDGGEINNALSFAMSGITREASYPYTARAGVCRSSTPVLQVSDYAQVTQNDEQALAAAVALQPIAVGVEADSAIFQFYRTGIITSQNCGTTLNQALLIVGYGTENGIPYWICKNSWGAGWGEAGYVRIGRNISSTTGPGICGIASYPWSANVVTAS